MSTINLIRIFSAFLLGGFFSATAQDLDPRAYVRTPMKTTTMISGFSFSDGEVLAEATLPIQNIRAKVQIASIAAAKSFNFFGKTSSILVAVPYSWAQVSGEVFEQFREITRSGFADTRLRWTVLFAGAPAGTVEEVKKSTQRTILGASINMVLPTGQFFSDKLINIGANRFAFRPELAISHRLGKRWIVDFYPGLWFFTNNTTFYPGNNLRSQQPMGTFQGHVSYNINPITWIALNATYYTGGTSSVEGVFNDDRQSNLRLGGTLVFPTGKFSSLKLAGSTGAVVRIGQDFTTFSVGWQRTWIKGLSKKPATQKG